MPMILLVDPPILRSALGSVAMTRRGRSGAGPESSAPPIWCRATRGIGHGDMEGFRALDELPPRGEAEAESLDEAAPLAKDGGR